VKHPKPGSAADFREQGMQKIANDSESKLFSDDTLDTAFGWDEGKSKNKGGSPIIQPYKRCFESHPPLPLGKGLQIYGGSCSAPLVPDADVYVGLDGSMRKTVRQYPWEPGDEFLFLIRDMNPPDDPKGFVKMIEWLAVQLIANRKVHVGCVGGHGRTGMVLSSLAKVVAGEDDAITYVREHYCKKVVESESQVAFLVKLFGIKKVVPYKPASTATTTTTGTWGGQSSGKSSWTSDSNGVVSPFTGYKGTGAPFSGGSKIHGQFRPIWDAVCMWGSTACQVKG
jgi:hypothetical protein